MGLQSQIHEVLDLLSNNEADKLEVEPEELARMARKAGQSFEEAILRQFTRQDEEFRFRMSNMGKPLCQLQMANKGAKKERKDYNFIMRMLHGDAIECIMDLVLELSKVNVTGGKSRVELELEGYTIKGEDDVEIDDKVYDIKSSSPFAFEQKWKKGLPALKSDDPFGYVGQLIGYSDGQNKKTGGWIVVCKSTGQVVVVDADFSDEEKDAVLFSAALSQWMTSLTRSTRVLKSFPCPAASVTSSKLAGLTPNFFHSQNLRPKSLRKIGTLCMKERNCRWQ